MPELLISLYLNPHRYIMNTDMPKSPTFMVAPYSPKLMKFPE